MKIVDSTYRLITLPFYPLWIMITFSLYIFSQIIQLFRTLFSGLIRRIVYYLKQESLPAQTVKLVFDLTSRFWNWSRSWRNRINSAKEINPISFFRRRRNEEQIAEMLERAEANPTDITEDQKVLILMQKMKKLQELVFQQSSDRRKAESELHEIKSQLTKKNAILIKERSESVQNLQKINLLNSQLRQKNELIQIEKAKVEELRLQIQNMKKVIQYQQKNQEREVQEVQEEQKDKQPIVSGIIQKVEQKIEQIFQQKQNSAQQGQKNGNQQSNQENGSKKEQDNSEKQNQEETVNENTKKTTTKKKKKKFVANN